MSGIPGYSGSELWIIASALGEDYSVAPEICPAETEIRINRAETEPVVCAALCREFDDLTECTTTLLQVQADHHSRAHATGMRNRAAGSHRIKQSTGVY